MSRVKRFSASLRDKRYGQVLLELMLLVAGILIALAVNGWIEDRRDATTHRQYLERLVRDLSQDLEVVKEFVDFEERQTEDALLAYRALCGGVDASDPDAITRALDHLTTRRTVRLARGTYADLLATGNLRLISDAALRDGIVRLYEANERWTTILDRNNQLFVDQMYLLYMLDSGLVEFGPDSNLPAMVPSRQEFIRRLEVTRRPRVDRLSELASKPAELDVFCTKLWYRGFISMDGVDQARTTAKQIVTVRDEIAVALGRGRSANN